MSVGAADGTLSVVPVTTGKATVVTGKVTVVTGKVTGVHRQTNGGHRQQPMTTAFNRRYNPSTRLRWLT